MDQLSHPDSRGEQQFLVQMSSRYLPLPRMWHRQGPHAATMSSSSGSSPLLAILTES
jgi:hypothetical protein